MVMDGQGGGIGRAIIKRLRESLDDEVEIVALGTNSVATAQMMKAGANRGATGENAIITMAPLVWFTSRSSMHQLGKHRNILISLGLINALKYFFQLAALQITLVAYVISIKRTSAILCVIFGALIFKETGIKERLTGSVIMVLGVLLITL